MRASHERPASLIPQWNPRQISVGLKVYCIKSCFRQYFFQFFDDEAYLRLVWSFIFLILVLVMVANIIWGCFLGILCSCVVALCRALYGSHTDVVELTASNFNSQVMDSDAVWLVEFYAPWYVIKSCVQFIAWPS